MVIQQLIIGFHALLPARQAPSAIHAQLHRCSANRIDALARAWFLGELNAGRDSTLRSSLLDLCKKTFELTSGELKAYSGATSRGSS